MNDPVGSAAEEAVKLFGAAQEWVRTRLDHEHLATDAVECQVCPLCQGVAALRQVRPETVEHLVAAAGSVVAALRAAFPHGAPHAGPPAGSAAGATHDAPSAESPGAGVQYIDVSED